MFDCTCDVPQLQTHRLLVPVEDFESEVHPDGGSVVGAEVVMHIPLDDAGLSDPEVSYHKNLIEVLLVVVVLHGDRGGRELSMNPPERKRKRSRGRWRRRTSAEGTGEELLLLLLWGGR